ncbi:MAG: FUN14 domain-containing protein [Candidatus Wallbacteria bacterium]|nr:FUN14 domain-containing protein [Candidatus Wallbacteria bacterium]
MELPAELIAFFAGVAGFGGLTGFAAGFATKKTVKLLAFFGGLFFIILQILAYKGIITVNWEFLQQAGGGLLRQDSLESGMNAFLRVISVNLPFAGAFGAGFWFGLKKG